MKSFALLKISMVLLVSGAALFFAPGARAQSEISPDHFDGTDSWAAKAVRAKAAPVGTKQAQAQTADLRQSLRHDAAQVEPAKLVTVEKKRQTAADKPKQ